MPFKKLKLLPFDELIVSGSNYTLKPVSGILEHMGTEMIHEQTLNRPEFFHTLKGATVETNAEVAYVTRGNMRDIWKLVEMIIEHQQPEKVIYHSNNEQKDSNKSDRVQIENDKSDRVQTDDTETVQWKTDHNDTDNSYIVQTSTSLNLGKKALFNNKFVYKIVGNGKSTLCQTLCNILTRLNRRILLIELDPSQGHLCFPGVLGIRKMHVPVIVEDYSNSLLYFYGNDKIENMEYYKCLRERILENRRLLKDCSEKMIEILLDGQVSDDIDNIFYIVVGNETLFHQISSNNKYFVSCHRYQKKDKHFKIQEYFYGEVTYKGEAYKGESFNGDQFTHGDTSIPPTDESEKCFKSSKENNNTFLLHQSPTPVIMKKHLKIHQIGEQFLPPMSALPIGHDRKTNNLMIRSIRPEQNSIIAISYGKDERELLEKPVKGFLMYMGEDQWLTVQDKINDGMFISGNIRVSECFE